MEQEIVMTRSTRDRLAGLVAMMRGRADGSVLAFLDQEIARARVVEPAEVPPGTATLGSRVRYRYEPDGARREARLVLPSSEKRIVDGLSVLTPVGACLIGLAEGGSSRWVGRDGAVTTVVLEKVLSQPEATAGVTRGAVCR